MNDLRDRLQDALRDALKQRDRTAIRAVRSAVSAIANAEAVDAGTAPAGVAEVARRELAGDDLYRIVAGEISDRRVAAEKYHESGRMEPADLLRQEADLLERILLGG